MLISPAYAQADNAAGGFDPGFIVMMGLLFLIMYLFMFRPQQKKAKQQREMIEAVRRGDNVVTQGGLIGKVSKVVSDEEIMIEIAEGVRVRVVKNTLADVRSKSEPIKTDAKADSKDKKGK